MMIVIILPGNLFFVKIQYGGFYPLSIEATNSFNVLRMSLLISLEWQGIDVTFLNIMPLNDPNRSILVSH